MKKNLLYSFCLSLVTTFSSFASVADSTQSLLWKISSPEMSAPSYLFGTIHLICKDDYIWTEKMNKSLTQAKEVCMEMDMDDPSILMEVASGMISAEGKMLSDYFSKEDYALVEQFYKDSLGINISMLATMKPIVLQTLITSNVTTCDSTVSYELKISDEAKRQNKEITGLETASEQIALLNKIPIDSIISDVIKYVKGDLEELEEYHAMIAAYRTQNLPALHELILKAKEEGDDMNAFLDERNIRWIDRMTDKMDQKSVFFAVGAGHLWGDNGLINLLRSHGYTVEPVK